MDFINQQTTPQPAPKNWLVESILATIFCCLPFGIAGIVFAVQVNKLYEAGDYQGAIEASANAGKWTKISFWVSVAGIVLCILFVTLFGGMAVLNSFRN
jgi:spore maturation protein SpmB